ncbi:MAG: PKD domain-containing protein [Bacteroidota bacterium]
MPLVTVGCGAAFSPNNRFLYLPLWKSLYQVDLQASNPDTVLIDQWDGFYDTIPGTFYISSTYGAMLNSPDGRIYSVNTNSSTHYVNLIENPNLPAPYCKPRQHAVYMPTLTGAPPNLVDFRLGPVDGSICDSLGINNVPWAWWRYEQDTSNYGTLQFTDLSRYEPTHWQWDFGDGTMSQDTSPVHRFAAPGVYVVCLIVSNAYGADTLCRTINIATVATSNPAALKLSIELYPNPFTDALTIQWDGYLPESAGAELYDATGKKVAEQRLFSGWNTLNLNSLPTGLYACRIVDKGWLLGTYKVLKM